MQRIMCHQDQISDVIILSFVDQNVPITMAQPCPCSQGSHEQYENEKKWWFSEKTLFAKSVVSPTIGLPTSGQDNPGKEQSWGT